MSSIELFSNPVCPYAQRSHLVLLEKGIPFKVTEIDLDDPPASFRKVSPYGSVPALRHGDVTVCESGIINEYLDEAFPEPALMPRAPAARARARFWIDFCNTRLAPYFYKLLAEQDTGKRPQRADTLRRALRYAEEQGLNGFQGNYWLGSDPTLVDFAFYPFFERLHVLHHFRGFSIPKECRRLTGWFASMRARDSVCQLARDSDFYTEAYAALAEGRKAPAVSGDSG